ncbi:hypothetical protein M9H77_31480 [Catharanthus roseus]|uniref:Uncharacterized protein n=1 Tax=Catharanthus roseus TaxID=4058 RepID=A0ACC0A4G2_CATRO|nr:hypothetical protein M9H77_31480 [Catharanthus roseus]
MNNNEHFIKLKRRYRSETFEEFIKTEEARRRIPVKRRGPYGRKKYNRDNWKFYIKDRRHNYKIGVYPYAHAQTARLRNNQLKLTEKFSRCQVAPRNIMATFLEKNPDCAVKSLKLNGLSGGQQSAQESDLQKQLHNFMGILQEFSTQSMSEDLVRVLMEEGLRHVCLRVEVEAAVGDRAWSCRLCQSMIRRVPILHGCTHWNSFAPRYCWMDVTDYLILAAKTFNLSIILIVRQDSCTISPFYSVSDHVGEHFITIYRLQATALGLTGDAKWENRDLQELVHSVSKNHHHPSSLSSSQYSNPQQRRAQHIVLMKGETTENPDNSSSTNDEPKQMTHMINKKIRVGGFGRTGWHPTPDLGAKVSVYAIAWRWRTNLINSFTPVLGATIWHPAPLVGARKILSTTSVDTDNQDSTSTNIFSSSVYFFKF